MIEPANHNSVEFALLALQPEERNAILQLRQVVPRLTSTEKVALSVLTLNQYDPDLRQWIHLNAATGFNPDLSAAVLGAAKLPRESKLALAILCPQLPASLVVLMSKCITSSK